MIVAVTGGRAFNNRARVKKALVPYAERRQDALLLVGGGRGADEQAREVWHYDFQLPYVVVPAMWNWFGHRAGPMRNERMLSGAAIAPFATLLPEALVAFPGSRGTAGAIAVAERLGIPIHYA